MEINGMDTVFRVYNPNLITKVYLLDEWGSVKDNKIFKWVQNLSSMEVGDRKESFLTICSFNCNNIAWSGKSVLTSIILNLW